ncbi:ATP-binding protein [Halovivax gelatinilyticus]|uniref:ATP-binding protein n=1 Tax=Halovivax gelatinilyticus TaxID=2961597 RepID=UPI0020CA4C57|nr:tetratricopeptide repeat protein [Halovivax gelatinilyticus]
MTEYGLEEFILLALAERERASVPAEPTAVTPSSLGDVLTLSQTVADRLSLLSALSTLTSSGLVEETTETLDGRAGERSLYRLSEAGRSRANELFESVADEPVTVYDGDDPFECRMGALPDRIGVSVTNALVRRSPDRSLTLEESVDQRFVGRQSAITALESALDSARNGIPQTLVVTGDAGVGKTTLVESFVDRYCDDSVDVRFGRSLRDGGQAYGPLVEAIGGAIGDSPLLSDGVAPDPDDAESYQAQLSAFYNDVTSAIESHARETPTVLIVEDLQWADPATVELLTHVATTVEDASLLLVATYRPSRVGDEHPFVDSIDENRFVELRVDPFDRTETAALIEAELGRRGVPDAFVDGVYDGTGGNALFVVETVASLLESGALDPRVDRYPDTVEAEQIPDVVETTIERRFDRLDDRTERVLSIGAVLGSPIPEDVLIEVVSRSEPAVRERIELLVDGGVWRRSDDGDLLFRSEVLRSAALDRLAENRRRTLHATAARTLAAAEADPATIATHFERAGDAENALEYHQQAADDAVAVYAHDVAIEHYERALSLARDADRDEFVLDLLESIGDIHSTRGRYDEAKKHFRYVRERTDDPERVRRSYRYQAEMAFKRSKYDEAEEYARQGLDVGGDEITEEVCRLTDQLGGAYFGRGQFEEAIEHHERLRDRSAEIGFTLGRGRANQNLGCCYGDLGEADRSVELLERGARLLETVGDEGELAGCYNDLSIAYDRVGRYDDAIETMEACLDVAERTEQVMVIRLAKANLALYALRRGEWERSREFFEGVEEIARRVDDRQSLSIAVWLDNSIELEVGHVDDAIVGFERALEIVRETEANHRIALYEWGIAQANFLAGNFDRTIDHIERAVDIATEHEYTRILGACKSVRGSVERERGEVERAITLQREAVILVADVDDEHVLPLRQMRLARTLCRAGETEEALELARAASEGCPDGDALMSVKIEATNGAAQLAAGEYDTARETLESAVERARGLSNEARLYALCELGRLEIEVGNDDAARGRLEEGLRLVEESGIAVYAPRLEELLATVEREPSVTGD